MIQRYRMSAATYEMVMRGLVAQRVPVIVEINEDMEDGYIYIVVVGGEPNERDSEATGDDAEVTA